MHGVKMESCFDETAGFFEIVAKIQIGRKLDADWVAAAANSLSNPSIIVSIVVSFTYE